MKTTGLIRNAVLPAVTARCGHCGSMTYAVTLRSSGTVWRPTVFF